MENSLLLSIDARFREAIGRHLVSREATGVIDRTVWLCVEGIFPGRFPITVKISTVEVLDGREVVEGVFSGCSWYEAVRSDLQI